MTISVTPSGEILFIYTEAIDLSELGEPHIERVSNIWYSNLDHHWQVEVGNLVVFTHRSREACIQWEKDHDGTIIDLATTGVLSE
jgi:hypothetical protein